MQISKIKKSSMNFVFFYPLNGVWRYWKNIKPGNYFWADRVYAKETVTSYLFTSLSNDKVNYLVTLIKILEKFWAIVLSHILYYTANSWNLIWHWEIPDDMSDIGCFMSQLTVFQPYMWLHIHVDVQPL